MPTIRRAGVLGAGVMGAAIAAHLANAGLDVLLLDRVPDTRTDEEAARGLNLTDPAVRNRFATLGIERALHGQAGTVLPAGLCRADHPRQLR